MVTAHEDEHSLCFLLTSAEGVGKTHFSGFAVRNWGTWV